LKPALPATLEKIVRSTEARVAKLKESVPFATLEKKVGSARKPHDFRSVFQKQGTHVIAEVKFASPSEGTLSSDANPNETAKSYLTNGAAALSILTEPEFFKGDVRYLESVRRDFPDARLLMKDFILDEYQLFQARLSGADAALILLAMLTPARALHLYAQALELGLTPLVETHNEAEMETAAKLGAKLIGVNNRDLKTMIVSLETSRRLAKQAPKSATLVSESGIKTAEDIKGLSELGYKGFLIGTQFMKTGKPGEALGHLLKAAR
jgi:indole-3-glycerol phosphate synthase